MQEGKLNSKSEKTIKNLEIHIFCTNIVVKYSHLAVHHNIDMEVAMIKYSVKKPFTVLVAVIIVLVVGFVALTGMKTDLLPEMSMPYMVVVTTYPGASPEKVEEHVTKPMEAALGTINGVENVTSTSAENYSMIMLEFEEDTSMDSAMVKVSSATNQLESLLPDTCGTPNIMEISMDMMATMYASVSYEGKDIYDLSDFTQEVVIPRFERQAGVASVSDIGIVEKTIEVRLNQEKVNAVNEKILLLTNDKLADAKNELSDAESSLADARAEINKREKDLSDQQGTTTTELADASLQLSQAVATRASYESQLTSLKASKSALEGEKKAYKKNKIESTYNSLNEMFVQMRAAAAGMQEQLGAYSPLDAAQMPADIKDAIDNPAKLKYFKTAIQTLAAMPDSQLDPSMVSQAAELDKKTLKQLYDVVNVRLPQIETELANLEIEIKVAEEVLKQVETQMATIDDAYKQAEEGKITAAAGFGSGSAQIAAAKTAMDEAKEELENANKTYQDSVTEARKNANIDQMLTLDALSGMIYAQNFSMPAGYIDDENDKQWLLKVGENYTSQDELQKMVLCEIKDIGDIRLEDVADLTTIDNAGDSYAKINGDPGIILSIFKGSTAGTSDVSKECLQAIEEMKEDYPELNITPLVDQGEYISVLIQSITSSMVIGALLAIFILAVFLMDIRPTLVVAFSIPFSVLTAIVIMYFTGISINMMSLSGLSLGIGMLVDNSIVVIENIYRLRYRGLTAPRAAVQGAKQVAGAIIASTLTTICVFFPMVFTTGMVRDLLLPFALTITFSLTASLAVALTTVPTIGSVLLKKATPKPHRVFDKVQEIYAQILKLCLRFKIVPLGISIALLVFCMITVINMGIVLIPDMGSDQISVTVTIPEEDDKDTAYQKADAVLDAVLAVEGVEYAGVMDASSSAGLVGGMGDSSGDNYGSFSYFVLPKEDFSNKNQVEKICSTIEENTKELECEVAVSNSMMGEMDEMLGSGLQVDIYGADLETLKTVSEEFVGMLEQVEGFANISNGQEEADEEIHLNIDKDKSMRLGLTGAQIYGDISDRLTTDKTAVTMTVDETDMDVVIVDEMDLLTKENLMDMEFETQKQDDDGKTVTETHKLSEFATLDYGMSVADISRSNGERFMSVTADTKDGYNTTILSREVEELLSSYDMPEGYSYEFGGETSSVTDMVEQMGKLLILGFLLIYLVMVAQFQSLLSPFIVIFTVPLAFTGGLLAMLFTGEQMSLITLMGFLVLMGTVVNNGIVFVDYTNQLRVGGMKRHDALIATGKTRMRPILMTAFTTILAMLAMIFSQDTASELGRGMAIVVAGGLLYATFMTMFIVPVMYDILYRKEVHFVDIGDESMDDAPDDAAEFIEQMNR